MAPRRRRSDRLRATQVFQICWSSMAARLLGYSVISAMVRPHMCFLVSLSFRTVGVFDLGGEVRAPGDGGAVRASSAQPHGSGSLPSQPREDRTAHQPRPARSPEPPHRTQYQTTCRSPKNSNPRGVVAEDFAENGKRGMYSTVSSGGDEQWLADVGVGIRRRANQYLNKRRGGREFGRPSNSWRPRSPPH